MKAMSLLKLSLTMSGDTSDDNQSVGIFERISSENRVSGHEIFFQESDKMLNYF